MPNRALSHDGKKHVVTVPVRLRKLQAIESPPKHEGTEIISIKKKKTLFPLFRFSFYCCFIKTYQRFSRNFW
jgi:hypothetical protein